MIPMPEAPNAVAGVRDQELTVRDLARRVGARALGQWLIPFAVALLTFVVLSPALRNGFVEWDDQINLTNNEDYRGLGSAQLRSEEHTSELQSHSDLVCRLLLEK